MSQMPNPFGMNRSQPLDYAGPTDQAMARFFNAVYAWMCVGLAITASVAYLTAQHIDVLRQLGNGIFVLFIVEIGLVMVIARAVNRINASMATLLFIA